MDRNQDADAEDRNQVVRVGRMSNSYLVFFGWLAASVAGFGIAVLRASDDPPPLCQSTGFGSCWSDRDELIFLGWVFGFWLLLLHLLVGLIVTANLNRRDWSSFGTGTVAFFTSALVPAGAFLYIALQ